MKNSQKIVNAIEAMQEEFAAKMEELINAVERVADAVESNEVVEEDLQDDIYEGDPLTEDDLDEMADFQ